MKKIIFGIVTLLILFVTNTLPLFAATVKSGDSVYLPENETDLKDTYLFGNDITVDASVTNDLTAAGNDITVNGNVTGSIMAAGSDIVIRSQVEGAIRAAGGKIVISGPVNRDVLVAGGDVRITSDASINGDLLFAGGELRVEGPIKGNIHANGGSIVIDAPVDGNVQGTMGELTFGRKANIAGDLRYTADQKATLEPGAKIAGRQEYRPQERKARPDGPASFFSGWGVYKLAIDIIISLLLVTFTPLLVKSTLERAINKPFASAGTGFLLLIFIPFFSLFLLFLLWLGIMSFLLYGLLVLLSIFFTKLLIGWWILRWWNKREKKEYVLDWKAAVVGPIVGFLLLIIPILGWLALCIIYLMAFGALTRTIISLATTTNALEKAAHPKK